MYNYNLEDIKNLIGEDLVRFDEPMKNHTTFKAGGPAKIFFTPENKEQIIKILDFANTNNIKTFVIGNGSNLLVSDKGIDGIVIQIYNKMNSIYVDGAQIYAKAGSILSTIANKAKDLELTGFEFAAGIPGTFGGAIVMNAGAYGGEIKDVVESVDVLVDSRDIVTLTNKEMDFSYRHSIITDTNSIVLGGTIKLEQGNKEEIQARMKELREARTTKQPIEYPSAGSTFKRPVGHFAGKLIQDSELSGYSIGGAMVSTKHCGFVINHNNATATDIMELMNYIKKVVLDKTGVELEAEVKLLGDF